MPNDLSGEALDARFFEVCWGWSRETRQVADAYVMHFWHQPHVSVGEGEWMRCPPVSTDATACEAWAMRWSRQANLRYEICEMQDHVLVVLVNFERDSFEARGADWKQAFVRACVAAGEILNQAKGGV